MNDTIKDQIHGYVRVFTQDPEGNRTLVFENNNQIQDDYAKILPLMIANESGGKINTLYLEYENVDSITDTVTPTTFQKEDGCSYYTALSGNTDFIRHSLVIKPVANEGSVTFSALIGTATGHHGLAFGTGVHSRIYSMALVAAKNSDQTQDLVFARKNWDTQKIKSTDDIYIEWDITFAT